MKVLVVDDQAVVREGLVSILGQLPGVEVAGSAGDGAEAVALAAEHSPDVVLMDLRMPGMDGVEATRRIRHSFPRTQVVVLTTYADDGSILDAVTAGAVGYLTKDAGRADIHRALLAANSGQAVLDSAVYDRLVATARTATAPWAARSLPDGLTEREGEVLALIATGLSNKEIAARLYVSEVTVKSHINRIFTKTHSRDRGQAVAYAHRHALTGKPLDSDSDRSTDTTMRARGDCLRRPGQDVSCEISERIADIARTVEPGKPWPRKGHHMVGDLRPGSPRQRARAPGLRPRPPGALDEARLHLPPADGDRALIRRIQPEDQAHRGGFPGPVRPEETGHPAGMHVEGQAVDGGHAAIALGQAGQADHRFASGVRLRGVELADDPVGHRFARVAAVLQPPVLQQRQRQLGEQFQVSAGRQLAPLGDAGDDLPQAAGQDAADPQVPGPAQRWVGGDLAADPDQRPGRTAYAATVRALITVITTLDEQVSILQEQVGDHFGRHPDAEIYLSQPGMGPITGARVPGEFGDDPHRCTDGKARRNYASTSPSPARRGRRRPSPPGSPQ